MVNRRNLADRRCGSERTRVSGVITLLPKGCKLLISNGFIVSGGLKKETSVGSTDGIRVPIMRMARHASNIDTRKSLIPQSLRIATVTRRHCGTRIAVP